MSEQQAEPWVHEHKDEPKKDKPPQFQIGDVVQLKCGGPMMMVTRVEHSIIEKTDIVTVIWHRSDGALHANQQVDCRLLKKADTHERNSGTEPPAGS